MLPRTVEPERLLTIAFDAMGGYHAPEAPVQAAAAASLEQDFHCVLVGDARRIDALLQNLPHNPEKLSVHHAPHTVAMGRRVTPGEDLDWLRHTSIDDAAELLGQGRVDALVTAGHAGLAILAMKRHVPMIAGLSRAAIAAVVPTHVRHGEKQDPFSLLLDVGATDHATAQELVAFAVMGAAYARCISQNPCPRVALLSNSREPRVGPPAVVEAHQLLAAMSDDEHFSFIGNIEGHLLPRGEAQVVVCDGWTGNIVVRLLEGIAETAVAVAREAYETKLRWRLGLSMLQGGLEQLRQLTDWKEYGGAPLLGFTRPVLVTHAGSSARVFGNAARVLAKTVRTDVISRIEANLR